MNSKFQSLVFILGITTLMFTVICDTTQATRIVNVAVLCDYECSRLFNHNVSEIDRHIMSIFWDANLSFKTLKSSKIFFQVSSVTQINNRKFQPVIENEKNKGGSIPLSDLLTNVKKLFYEQLENKFLTEFDVGLFITGEKSSDNFFVAEQGSLFNIDDKGRIFHGTIILRLGSHSQNYCSVLAGALGITLGNPGPDTEYQNILTCHDKSYIDTYQCGNHHHFFSTCADKQISEFLPSYTCLHQLETFDIGQDNSKYEYRHHLALTMEEQCRLHYNSSTAFTKEDDENCIVTKCYDLKFWVYEEYIGNIHPLSGTKCGNSKFCFRGRCIPKGFRIANVRTKTCLATSDSFDSNDKPSLLNCPSFPTPLDQFTFHQQEINGIFYIVTPFSTKNANENGDKCLSIDLSGKDLVFRPCSFPHKSWLEWRFIGKSGSGFSTKFMLFHPKTQNCLEVDFSDKLVITQDCYEDDRFYWKVFEYEIPAQQNLQSGHKRKTEVPVEQQLVFLAVFLLILCILSRDNGVRMR